MERTSVIRRPVALNRAPRVALATDSQYVCRGAIEWVRGCKTKGWNNASEQPVNNPNLWERLDGLCEPHKVGWHCVKGSGGHLENERADALANRGINELGEGRCDK